ncbi:MAG: ATP phosphoribosyltransferase [Synergistaceae bacterium]
MLTFALPTGRSLQDGIELLGGAGLPVEKLKNPGRNLVIEDSGFKYLLTKPSDVPAMVHYGVADLGLAGSDVIKETEIAISELLDTGRAKCVMAVAGPAEMADRFDGDVCRLMGLKVATKYTTFAEKTFASWGIQIKILKLNGSVELAPALGLSDCIFDVVQTGTTLKANGLTIIKEAEPISMRLIAGTGSMQMNWEKMFGVVESIHQYVKNNPK